METKVTENVGRMDLVRVKKEDLLSHLKDNFEKHNKILKKAREQYWVALQAKLAKMIERAKQHREVPTYIDLREPQDHSDDYKMAIAMLEHSIDTVIALTPQEFSKFFLNNWSWRSEFVSTARNVYGAYGVQGVQGAQGCQGTQGPVGTDYHEGDFVAHDGTVWEAAEVLAYEKLLDDFEDGDREAIEC